MSEYVNDEKKYVQKSPGLCVRSKQNSRCIFCASLGRNEKSCDVHKPQSDRATTFAVAPAVTARDGLRARAGDRRLVAAEAADGLYAQEAGETGERRRALEAGDDGRARGAAMSTVSWDHGTAGAYQRTRPMKGFQTDSC